MWWNAHCVRCEKTDPGPGHFLLHQRHSVLWASPSPMETKQEEKSRPCVHHKRTAKPDLIGKHIYYPHRFILRRNTENIFTHLISCESQNGTKEAVMLKSAVKTPSTLSSCGVCKLTRG